MITNYKNTAARSKYIQKMTVITGLSITFCLFACERFIDIPVPVDQLVTGSVFSTDATATAAMSGVYQQMMESLSSYSNGMLTLYGGLSSDELVNSSSTSAKIEFYNNNINAANAELKNNIWDRLYKNIYQANAVLAGIKDNDALSVTVINQLEAEARFIRGFCHFYLLNLFGSIPYIVSTDYRINAAVKQTDQKLVYRTITEDLLSARSLLTAGSAQRLRPDKFAATAMLARVYLYQADYAAAETQASVLINNADYQLEADLNEIFKANSREAIWRLRPVLATTNVGDGYLFVQTTGVPVYAVISDSLIQSIEAGDKRKTAWVNSYTYNSRQYNLPYKYKIKSAPVVTEYNTVLRLAEMYLIRAEARAQQGDLSGAAADINVIRSRAGLPPVKNKIATEDDMLTAIAKERRIELFAEWAHRWMDLKRTGKVDSVLSAVKPSWWQPADDLYPIPKSELLNNPFLIQNLGYN